MAKKDDWTTCGECEAEFKIISDSLDTAGFCPYCGYELEEDDLSEDEEWDD